MSVTRGQTGGRRCPGTVGAAWLGLCLVVGACSRSDGGEDRLAPARASAVVSVAAAPSGAAGRSPELRALTPAGRSAARLLLEKAKGQDDRVVRARMAAGILVQLEEGRLPERLLGALAAASERRVGEAQRAKTVWQSIAETPAALEAWNRSCASGPFVDGGRIMALLAPKEATPARRAALVFGMCNLEQGGLLGLAELSLDVDLVVLAHTLRTYIATRASLEDEELEALSLLAQGGRRPQRPIEPTELPRPEAPRRLSAVGDAELQTQVRHAVALLGAGATKRFLQEVVHPHELGGVELDEAASIFSRSDKSRGLREALGAAVGRPGVDEGEGEASIRLPWRPGPDLRERLRFQRFERRWYLRL